MNSSPEKSLDDAASGRPMKAVGIEDEQEAAGGFASFVRIFTYARRADYLTLSAALLATFVSGAAMALVNLVVGEFVNILGHFATGASSPEQFRASAAEYSLLFVYIGIARLAGVYLYASLSTYAAYHTTRNLRHAYLRAALSQEVAFFDRGVVGSISAQATSNGRLIQSGIAEKLGMVFQALATFVGAFIIAFIVDWKLTLILLCIAPALLLVMGIVAGADSKVETQMLKVQAQGASFAETILSSARNVNAFGLRARLMYRFEEYLEEAFRLGKKKNAIYGALFSAEFTIVYLGIALAFWQGLKLTVEGDIPNVGVVYTVMMCVVSATISITAVAPSTVAFSRAATAAAELFKLIDRPSEINPFGKSGEKPAQIDGSLEFDGVTFAYPTRPGVNVLKEFSLHIPAGKMTALVGMSGSGKSTCIGLLERWYNPAAGSIKLDGRSISELNLNWLRTNIRLVQQEPVLFNGTVFENIANGLVGTPLEKASPAEQQASIESAAAAAFAHDFITALPDGYQTRIGERGGLLSGGQKQRIAIARSIVSNPRILLLDEATSALDPHAEGIVQQALDNASRERTTVVIAHKLATIRGADNIVVMAAGEMMEQGTHDQLLARGEAGAYFRMVKAQMLSNKMAASPDQEDDSGAVGKSVDSSDDEGKKQGDGGQGDAVMDDVAQAQSIVRYKTVEREHAVLLQNREDFERYQRSGFVRTIIKMIADSPDLKWVYLVVFVTCITAGGLITIQAVILAQSLNVFNSPDLASAVPRGNFLATMFIVLAVGCFVSWFANGWATNIMAQTLSRKVRRTLLDGFLRQDLRFFDRDENTVGALTSRLDSHPQSVLELMGFNLGIMLSSMVSVLASSILAIAVSWKLGLVGVFAGLPPLLAAGWLRIRLETRMETTADARFSNSASLASESIMAIRTVSSLATEEAVLKKYTSELDKATASLKRPLFAMMIWYAFTQSAEYFVLALGFWYGARQMSFGEATFYEFFVAFIGVFFAGQQAGILLSFSSSFTKGLYAANYYFWLQNLEPTIRETDENRDKGPRDNVSSMALDQVRFAYPLRPDSQVLRRVSLKVRPGSFVALVGASGCGKSTAMALLERFYDPSKGTILVDDADNLRELNPRLYRQQISLVQQEPTLYPGSIRDNVAYGVDVADDEVARGNHLHPGAKAVSDDKIEAALRAANAWDFVCSLPEGTRTVCGTSGSQLSGGQRQRIAIARALIRDPRVLLLDEATSALDTESEKVVQAALADAARAGGRITVAVAHRLSTVRDADLICVFYAGKIAESGTHEELLAMRGLYSKMCEAQSL